MAHTRKVSVYPVGIPHQRMRIMKDANVSRKSTPGKIKGERCKASPMDRIFAKRNRSYKYPGYDSWSKRGSKKGKS